jgi:hypothetical protein
MDYSFLLALIVCQRRTSTTVPPPQLGRLCHVGGDAPCLDLGPTLKPRCSFLTLAQLWPGRYREARRRGVRFAPLRDQIVGLLPALTKTERARSVVERVLNDAAG